MIGWCKADQTPQACTNEPNAMPQVVDLTILDLFAVFWLITVLLGIGWYVDNSPIKHPSASQIMQERRFAWMREMARRDVRILDGALLTGLQQSSSFFASTALVSLGGLLAVMGQAERLSEVADTLPFSHPEGPDAFRIRLFAPVIIIAYAFLKFAWAQRLFGYCAVLIGSTPEWDTTREQEIYAAADSAARVNGLAARSFARGLRGLYFTLGSLAFLIGPMALIACSSAVGLMIYRREFRSDSRTAMLSARYIGKD